MSMMDDLKYLWLAYGDRQSRVIILLEWLFDRAAFKNRMRLERRFRRGYAL